MYLNNSSRVAVLDLTHGGIVIARKVKDNVESVAAIDVYRTLSPEMLMGLAEEGITTSQDALKATDFDLLIAPVHLDPRYPMLVEAASGKVPVISHHAAVGEMVSRYDLKDKTIIEITGTKAKTSTALLLAQMASKEKKVVSHTTRGVEDWSTGTVIKKGLSITPASILMALDAVQEAGIDPEMFIFEVSLGGTGSADVGIITTVIGDYAIAKNTRMASDAKRQMILNAKPDSTLVINNDALRFFGACRRDVTLVSFTDRIDASCNVYYEERRLHGGTLAYSLGKKKHGRITIPQASDYDVDSYRTAMVCATAAALAAGIDVVNIAQTIEEFTGTEGRMKKTLLAGKTLIDNSNSGMDMISVENALHFAEALGGRIVMVLGEEAQQVCEGLDPAGVKRFMDKHLDELGALILVGERMRPLVRDAIHHAENLPKGLDLAARLAQKNDILLSCVKCFR